MWDAAWLAECGAKKAAAPYAWSKFEHEYFDTVVAQLQNSQVMFDDEHRKSRGHHMLLLYYAKYLVLHLVVVIEVSIFYRLVRRRSITKVEFQGGKCQRMYVQDC